MKYSVPCLARPTLKHNTPYETLPSGVSKTAVCTLPILGALWLTAILTHAASFAPLQVTGFNEDLIA